jgi:hypothetical protein
MTNCIPVYYADKDLNLNVNNLNITGSIGNTTPVDGDLLTYNGTTSQYEHVASSYGTWDLNVSTLTNLSDVTIRNAWYIRLGNVVTAGFNAVVDPILAGGTGTRFRFELPVPTGNVSIQTYIGSNILYPSLDNSIVYILAGSSLCEMLWDSSTVDENSTGVVFGYIVT